MRKFAALILILVSALGLSACGNTDQSDIPVTEIDTQESKPEQEETPLPTDNDNNHTEVTSEMTTIQVIINGQEFEAEATDRCCLLTCSVIFPIQLTFTCLGLVSHTFDWMPLY